MAPGEFAHRQIHIAEGDNTLSAKSRLWRLHSETRLRAQSQRERL